jgi:hypothetical protein
MKRKCIISVDFFDDPNILFQKAQNAAKINNAKITGTPQEGTVEVRAFGAQIKGAYSVNANTVKIEIIDKPFFLSCSAIEKLIRKYVAR